VELFSDRERNSGKGVMDEKSSKLTEEEDVTGVGTGESSDRETGMMRMD